jgi:hypothetical protein
VRPDLILRALACVLVMVLVGCGSAGARPKAQAHPSPTPTVSPPPSPSPSPSQSPSPSPPPAAAAPAQPSSLPVTFTGLPNGAYPAHLHSICSGAQSFHITVLQSLVVRGESGAIQVPSGYFGRGLCVIVYGSPSLTSVLATKRI